MNGFAASGIAAGTFLRLASLAIGYVCGCFLTAEVVSRRVARKSSFDIGLGNPGMANIGHELGTKAAAAVLAGDIAKTLGAWLIARALFPADPATAGLWAGLGATLGHDFPFWHRFKGGKGVTTTCSAIILASPGAGIAASLIGLAIVLASGYLGLGAIAICVAYVVLMLIFGTGEQALVALVLAILMFRAHWPAVRGIRDGSTKPATISVRLRKRLSRRHGRTRRSGPRA